jgi:hypothetical protein
MGNTMRTFEPDFYEDVEASPPHPPNTKYRVSIGHEYWGESIEEVEKVQMVYDGRVSGRRAPSYPVGSDDSQRVMEALAGLRRKAQSGAKELIRRPTGHPLRQTLPTHRAERPRLRDLIGSAKGIYGTVEDVEKDRNQYRDEWR